MNKIEIHKDTICINNIIKDITIIHISDIHFNNKTTNKKLTKIKNTIINQKPNYLLITGDTLDSPSETKNKNIQLLITFLKDISQKCKIIISLGNHDIFKQNDFSFFNELNKLKNIYVLNNKCYIDDYIYISGFTLPTNYYYNLEGIESKEVLMEYLKKQNNLTNNLPNNIPKIGLIHSPIRLTEKEIISKLKEYDILLSGHTHNGLVPKILGKLFKKNQGLIAPRKQLFPKIARGNIKINQNNKDINIIINGGITKLGEKSTHLLSKFNFIYNIDINKIIITNKKGKEYE